MSRTTSRSRRLRRMIDRASWDQRRCRVERNVDRLLDLFAERGAHATFFTLGWIAERYPQPGARDRRRRPRAGQPRLRAPARDRAEPRRVPRRTCAAPRSLLEDIGGQPVRGYRAPSFSIGARNLWAFDVLLEAGYRYSSSVYPVRHDHYGMPDAPRFPYDARPGLLRDPDHDDAPARPQPACRRRRLLPARALRAEPLGAASASTRSSSGRPSSTFIRGRSIPAQPRVPGTSLKTRFRHYVNLAQDRIAAGAPAAATSAGAASTRSSSLQLSMKPRRTATAAEPDGTVRAAMPRIRPRGAGTSSSSRCPDATFFHRIGWREIYERCFAIAPHYLLAERGGADRRRAAARADAAACCSATALVSLPFAVYGGVAAVDAEASAGAARSRR